MMKISGSFSTKNSCLLLEMRLRVDFADWKTKTMIREAKKLCRNNLARLHDHDITQIHLARLQAIHFCLSD